MFSYSHTVQYYETDKMGVTHHSNVNGKPHTWSKKSAALAGGQC